MPSPNSVDASREVAYATSSTVDPAKGWSDADAPASHATAIPNRSDLLRQYADQDARLGSPNPRYKQCNVYCDRYLDVRISLVGTDGLTDTEWDLTIF